MKRNYSEDSKDWDLFISHASEDKDSIARSLAQKLQEYGLRIWYDDFALRVGDSLNESINRGIANSRYGVVILSPNFIRKKWTLNELNGLVAREEFTNQIILPIWHEISEAEVRSFSPILADRIAIHSSDGVEYVANKIIERIGNPNFNRQILGVWRGTTGRLYLTAWPSGEVTGSYDWNGFMWAGHLRGTVEANVLRFQWYWDINIEKGNGFFEVRGTFEKRELLGGWAFDYDYVDLGDVSKVWDHPKLHEWKFSFFHTYFEMRRHWDSDWG